MEDKKNPPQDQAYEFAFKEVPQHKRKRLISLTLVLAGYPIALSNFVVGGEVGSGLSFIDALIALVIGNAVLISIVITTGLLAYKTGLSTAFLSKRAFGKSGSHIFSFLLAFSAVTWVSLNGDIFARLIDTTFSWWSVPVSITAVIVIFMWLFSAINGYKGLAFISSIGVPAAILLSIYGIYAVGASTDGFAGVLNYNPESPITLTAATASIVGGWVFGATITPDVCRFAKKKSHVFIAGSAAFIVGCFGFQFAGAIIAISTGIGDFTEAMVALGIGLLAFFVAIFALWTTQDSNIYGASLASQNIIKETKFYGKIKHSHIAFIVATIAAIFAAGGIYNQIIPIINFLSILIPPVPGIIMAEEFFVKKPKPSISMNKAAVVAWLIGGVASYISLTANFFISPIVGILSAGITYIVLEKLKKSDQIVEDELQLKQNVN